MDEKSEEIQPGIVYCEIHVEYFCFCLSYLEQDINLWVNLLCLREYSKSCVSNLAALSL
jgi:hypothetical protein